MIPPPTMIASGCAITPPSCRRCATAPPARPASRRSSAPSRRPEPAAEGVRGVEAQHSLAGHEGAPADPRDQRVALAGEPAGEAPPGDALLPPLLPRLQLAAGVQ